MAYAIIRTDNYARETVAENFVAQHIPYESEAAIMLNALRDSRHEGDPNWYKIVKSDYQLWRGMAEFVDTDENEFFE